MLFVFKDCLEERGRGHIIDESIERTFSRKQQIDCSTNTLNRGSIT